MISPPGADADQVSSLGKELSRLSGEAGYRYQTRDSLSPSELSGDVKIVVAVSPVSNLPDLVKAAPDAQFVAVGIPGLLQAPNLTLIGSGADRQDQRSFMAGIIAAILTPEWRVGAISLADQPAGKAALQAFITGVQFFCGLCRQTYPPYDKYPLYVELSSNAVQADYQNAADYLIHHEVKTVYIYPGAQNDTLLTALDQAGVNLIGEKLPPAALRQHWAATLRSDPLPAFLAAWPNILKGQPANIVSLPVDISDVNPDLFSTGRQDLAKQILSELTAGYIDTGVNSASGDSH